jgi:hypothetical protein
MSVEEGAKFFRDNCYYEAKPAMQEALRGTYDPGYLFIYTREVANPQAADGITKFRKGCNYFAQNSFTTRCVATVNGL